MRFNDQPCNEHFNYSESHTFCENSGWGDEAASVVCRSELYSRYGIGGKNYWIMFNRHGPNDLVAIILLLIADWPLANNVCHCIQGTSH